MAFLPIPATSLDSPRASEATPTPIPGDRDQAGFEPPDPQGVTTGEFRARMGEMALKGQ